MHYLILFSDEQRPDNIGLPLWKIDLSSNDYNYAANRWRAESGRAKHKRSVWLQINESGLMRVMGYVDWTEQGEHLLHLNMPTELFEAETEATKRWFKDKGVF